MFPFKLTPKRVEYLTELELNNPWDVVQYFPRTYNFFDLTPLDYQHHNQRVVIKGIVKSKERIVRFSRNSTLFKFKVIYNEEEYTVIAFNRAYLPPTIIQGNEVMVVGKYNHLKKEINMIEVMTKGFNNLKIKPIYRLPEGITTYEFQLLLKLCFDDVSNNNMLEEIIPSHYTNKYRLINRNQAYHYIHFPSSKEALKQALRYLKYEELLVYSLSLQKLKSERKLGSFSASKQVDFEFVKSVIANSNFVLTDDQEKAVKEIINDLKKDGLMYRMLQGDVGCGKTLVAVCGLLANYSAGYQGVMMAPTDILARQHYTFISNFVKEFNIRVGLLVSSMKVKEKKEMYQQIANGEIDIIIGTHAIIQDAVAYHKLGMAVIDEQHRFGVEQRKTIKEKGDNVELLMMSATPIPRTLAITLYGDMDVSTLRTFPNQKRSVTTKVIKGNSIKSLLPEIKQRVANNERVFIVCPLIDESEERRNVTDVYEGLSKYFDGDINVGLLHGRLDDSEKEEIMYKFQKGDYSILVSTTVIEVGIDIKQASMMIIYDAQSFGLAAIHQLRGRVGRNGQSAVCYLMCSNETENSLKRLEYLQDHDDGFDIARFDLANRGPGDVVGTRQSGIPDLNISNIYDDLKILEIARDDAKEIMDNQDIIENKQIIAYVSRIKS